MSINRIANSPLVRSTTSLIKIAPRNLQNALCRAPKTLQEKCFLFLICLLCVILVVFIVTLWIISSRWKNTLSKIKFTHVEDDYVCETDACKETADNLIGNLDASADPCVDFYQYACGGWIEKNPIPDNKEYSESYDTARGEVRERIKNLIQNESNISDGPKYASLVGKVYKSCLDKEERNNVGIYPLKKLVNQFGGWPMLNDQWSEEGYVWYRHLAEVNRGLFKDIIFDFDFLPFLNNSEEYIIKLNKGKCLFDSIWFRTDENSTTNYTDAARTYIVGFALLLGSERDLSSLEAEADAVIDFDYKIHKTVDLEYYPSMYSIKMEEVNSWGNGTISYLDYINFHLPEDYPADNNTYLYMKMLDYFEYNLPEVILGANTKTIANYISFYMVSTFSKFASEDLLTLRNEFLSSIGIEFNMSDEQVCMTHIKSFMPDAVGRMYIDNYFPRLTEMHVQKMVDMIKLAYSSTLDQNVWMDKNTLLYALVKLQSIEMAIGYNSWISDDGLLNKHYEKVERVKDNGYLNIIIAFYETLSENSYGRWNRTVKKYEVYDEEPLYVINAFYGPQANFMSVPAGILSYPFYKYGRNDAINYGAIGTVIGHEMSHAFDDTGSIFDHKGNLRNWWTKTTKEKFLEKADCFSKQYEESDSWLPFAIDGNVTLGENIADNGGLRNAFKAFKLHLALADEHLTNRKILSGLSASPEQLFFIGYASIWCANMTEEFESRFGTSDPHNHPKLRIPVANMTLDPMKLYRAILSECGEEPDWGVFRGSINSIRMRKKIAANESDAFLFELFMVNVPLANSKEFARAFKCKSGTPMNPRRKCVLW